METRASLARDPCLPEPFQRRFLSFLCLRLLCLGLFPLVVACDFATPTIITVLSIPLYHCTFILSFLIFLKLGKNSPVLSILCYVYIYIYIPSFSIRFIYEFIIHKSLLMVENKLSIHHCFVRRNFKRLLREEYCEESTSDSVKLIDVQSSPSKYMFLLFLSILARILLILFISWQKEHMKGIL